MAIQQLPATGLEDGTHDFEFAPATDRGEHTFKNLQIDGTWGGATATVWASCDGGNNWADNDKDGNPLMAVADNAITVLECVAPFWIRVVISGGTGESLNVRSTDI